MIHLVDDDDAVTRSCRFLLESMGYTVQSWNQSAQFLRDAPLMTTGVALLDMRMPGMDGHALFQAMREAGSTLAVVFLTGHGDVPMAVKEMRLGAVDFLEKPIAADALQAAITEGYRRSARLNEQHALRVRFASLTSKEKEIAACVVAGLMNKDIAAQMNIAVRTVEVHRARVMEKMAAKNIAGFIGMMNQIS
ncbi:tetrathionate respiration response regulator TtrR [Shimwellia blattae]|uniref:Putative response regulator protein n=1 Tax=Shimwellia blattae (strain ATCC 29907 / DSM 4481 / JCM 1650 / NBRC 105725 / CDC 9005-74) TaxID=630626 RepID=I2B6U3_SHIBC|nr:tetrathionate respiration response regulator TtrR [Shimwellia blattae]AFJ46247.1 putative response regulator protein [Shimwellia blattae DSM 4481 = NBRC 105725]GAB81117.1 putative two-component response regulator [Shimwellia blattae DSM 4481 = NBRC 105725]VDY63712.1 Transcriptional regulatory protein fixJ [Shimwellia blattae]VEC21856.1 Transcriptional regulatory protein fixJ [Shimwellia blattae]